jgi:hypothetical protein
MVRVYSTLDDKCKARYTIDMASIDKIIEQMRRAPQNVSFDDLLKVCRAYFEERPTRGDHFTFKTTWQGDPRVNIQPSGKNAKEYQVKQVLEAVKRVQNGDKE